MNEHYDVIVLGTGLKECILSGLLSVSGKRVLHLDRNDYYGGESTSFNLQQIKEHLDDMDEETAKAWTQSEAETFGRSKEYNIDLCPKFIMASGELVSILLHTKVTRYLEFKCVDGSYVWRSEKEGGKLHEVPVTPKAVLDSPLMGMFQKRRYKNFLEWCMKLDDNDANSFKCGGGFFDGTAIEDVRNGTTPAELFAWWKVEKDAADFTAHAIALYTNDNYLNDPSQTVELVKRIKLYAQSLMRYEKSPYIYPLWGLGGLPEGFSRLAAVHGGVYMLRRPIDQILYNGDGTVSGIESQGEQATCDQLIGDPSYFAETTKIKSSGWICRVICILGAPIPQTKENSESCQIILSSAQTGHSGDIYISCISKGLECAPQNRFVAVISSRVASNDEAAALVSLAPALNLVEQVLIQKWVRFRETSVPINQQEGDNVFIPSSMDASTHFQLAAKEVSSIYAAMTGEHLDLTAKPEDTEEN